LEPRLPILLNVRSRQGRTWAARARIAFETAGVEVQEVSLFQRVEALVDRARALVAEGSPVIAVGGGDGTLGAACGAFLGSESAMMPLPAGTGNAFARDLGIPRNLDAAVRAVSQGEVRKVDVGRAQGRYFLNVATIGLTTLIAKSLDPRLKRASGNLAYAVAILRALRRSQPFELTIATEEEQISITTLQAVVGNGRIHGGPFPLSPTAGLGLGRLSAYAVRADKASDLLRYSLMLSFGGHVALREVWWAEPERCSMVAQPPTEVTVDGEVLPPGPLQAVCLPGALRVVAPKLADL